MVVAYHYPSLKYPSYTFKTLTCLANDSNVKFCFKTQDFRFSGSFSIACAGSVHLVHFSSVRNVLLRNKVRHLIFCNFLKIRRTLFLEVFGFQEGVLRI